MVASLAVAGCTASRANHGSAWLTATDAALGVSQG